MNTIILASLLVLLVSLTEIHGEFIKMCYYSAWAAYRDGDQALKPEDVDAHHCTHLALAYGTIDASGKRVKFPLTLSFRFTYCRGTFNNVLR